MSQPQYTMTVEAETAEDAFKKVPPLYACYPRPKELGGWYVVAALKAIPRKVWSWNGLLPKRVTVFDVTAFYEVVKEGEK